MCKKTWLEGTNRVLLYPLVPVNRDFLHIWIVPGDTVEATSTRGNKNAPAEYTKAVQTSH
jgi:hypothetical protein